MVTSPSELDRGELVDFEDDDDGVLVLFDGRVVRNVSLFVTLSYRVTKTKVLRT